jgi:hypothetical protein
MNAVAKTSLSKVPEVTLGFWLIKIAATTLGETGGDTVTMTIDLGYLAGTAIFLAVLVVLVGLQIAANKFHPFLYWSTIVASDIRHDHGRFCRPFVGYRLHGCFLAFIFLPHGHPWPLVLDDGVCFSRNGQHAKGGSILLGSNYVLPNARNGAWRLDSR